jgi:prevent-host-death family protein
MSRDRVPLHQAKTHLSALVDRARAGEEIVITKHGRPVARLVGLEDARPREPVDTMGVTWLADDFDAPLPPEVLKTFGIE